jgi:hypothetical protein
MEAVNNIPGAAPNAARNGLQEKLDAARQITMLFKMERYVYVSCCGIAVLLLLYCAYQVLNKETPDFVIIGSLFGSGGLITYSIGRLIFMWNKIVDIVLMEGMQKGGRDDGDK